MRLHPSLNPAHYNVSAGLRDVSAWRARVQEENCYRADAPKRGEMDRVVVVMISRTDDTFIPVAAQDMHHNGYAMLREKAAAWRIRPDEFFPLNPRCTCIFHREGLEHLLEVAPKWRAAGGPNFVVEIADLSGRNELPYAATVNVDDLLSGRFIPTAGEPERIHPVGERFLRRLELLAASLERQRARPFDDRAMAEVFRNGRLVLAQLREVPILGVLALTDRLDGNVLETLDRLDAQLNEAEMRQDINWLATLVYGWERRQDSREPIRGIKRAIHDQVRDDLDRPQRQIAGLFGHMGLANARLARIGGDDPEIAPSPAPVPALG